MAMVTLTDVVVDIAKDIEVKPIPVKTAIELMGYDVVIWGDLVVLYNYVKNTL